MIRPVLGSRASIGGPLGSGRGGAGNGLLTGLVAYWGLDEAGGANNALDKHSGGLTLTQSGDPGADTGKVYATARTFSGSQYFTRNSETALQTGNVDWHVAIWAYSTASTAGQQIISKLGSSLASREFQVFFSAGQITFDWWINASNGVAEATTTAGFSTDTWHLVECYHNATTNQIGVAIDNGTFVTQSANGGNAGAAAFRIGGRELAATLWAGRLGPVAMWKNRTLDATARAALWNGGAGLAYSAFS